MKQILFYFIFASPFIFSTASGQAFDLKVSIERGKSVYEAQCISCHMPEGEGLEGVFPPLAKSPNLLSKEKLVQTILKGVRGAIQLGGKEYNGEMASIALSDQETADVINYVRNSFGNKASAVLPKEIQPALKVVLKNYQPY
jgi:nitrite reductase (NO-forming)